MFRYFFYIRYCKSAFAQKLPLYCFPSVWNKWITSTINVKSKSQFKQVVKSKMLASFSNSVHCANLHCTDCHGQSSSSGLYWYWYWSIWIMNHVWLLRVCTMFAWPIDWLSFIWVKWLSKFISFLFYFVLFFKLWFLHVCFVWLPVWYFCM